MKEEKNYLQKEGKSIDKSSKPKVAIVVVNLNGKKRLIRCLNSIKKKTEYPNYEIIVVDNGSTDGSVEAVKKKFPEALLILNSKNLGYAKACNQGAKLGIQRGAEYIIFLENDTEVMSSSWIEKLIEVVNQDERIGIVGPRITNLLELEGRLKDFFRPNLLFFLTGRKSSPLSEPQEVEIAFGIAYMFSKKMIDKIGLLDEFFTPYGDEDLEYCLRARKAGFKIFFTPKVVIKHESGATIKKIWQKQKRQVFFRNVRNNLLCYRRYFSVPRVFWQAFCIFLFIFFERKNPNLPLNLRNIKPRLESFSEIPILMRALVQALSFS